MTCALHGVVTRVYSPQRSIHGVGVVMAREKKIRLDMIVGVDERVEDILLCKMKARYSDINSSDISDVDIIMAMKINPIIVTKGKSGYHAVANIRLLSIAKINLKKSTMINCIELDHGENARSYAIAGEFILMLMHARKKQHKDIKTEKTLSRKVKMRHVKYSDIMLVPDIIDEEYRFDDYGALTNEARSLINTIAPPCICNREEGYQVVANIPSSRYLGDDGSVVLVNHADSRMMMRVDRLITSRLHETSVNAQVYIAEMMKVLPKNEIALMFKEKMTKTLMAKKLGYRRESMFGRVTKKKIKHSELVGKNDLEEYSITIEGRDNDAEKKAG